jgi:Predicted integral membrane protein (DUF2269)
MSWYLLLKFIHVAAAIAWLGGAGATIFAAAMTASYRSRINIIEMVSYLSNRIFIPSLVIVLVTGATAWWIGALSFDAWVAWGLVGILITGGIGATILGPTAEKLNKAIAAGAPEAEVAPQLLKLLRLAQADLVGLSSIVFAMVMKPSWSDGWLLIVMLIVVLAGAGYFLSRSKMQPALT